MDLAFQLMGGIGLFLLGMVLLTDGIKDFAGDALRRWLVRFTGTPTMAFLSGAAVTLIVQSSSATTVTVIGFVSAGLLSFPQAVGVIFGASLGTTGTSWIVSVLGLKVSVGTYALPLIGVGALIKLLGSGHRRAFGSALAGFGLIFVGIAALQQSMSGLSSVFDLARLPSSGFLAHLLTMLIGIALAVIMQSSSAAIATSLTALHAGAINFEQASALVIGASVGTTITGALAAIGGSVPAKRTALAHVLFNLATGLIAVILLPLFQLAIYQAQEHLGLEPGAMSLAAFHTTFIAVGVAIFLPFVGRFSQWIERLLPDSGPALTRHLDATLLQTPAVALEATLRALRETAADTFHAMLGTLDGLAGGASPSEAQLRQAVERLQEFSRNIPPVADGELLADMRISQLHAMEHLSRMQPRLTPPRSVREVLDDGWLVTSIAMARGILLLGEAGMRGEAADGWLSQLEKSASELAELRRSTRPTILRQLAAGRSAPGRALDLLDAMRWLDRIGYHTSRICHYLGDEEHI